MIHRFRPEWGTHIPVLIKCLEKTKNQVLELGLGISSTPLLHALCFDQDKPLTSYDNEAQFVEMFKKYRSKTHVINLVENWDELNLTNTLWGVVLVDHKPEARRKIDIAKLANFAQYIIIHDSEPTNNNLYRYDEIYHLFKHRFDYIKTSAHTTVLSNIHDLNFLHHPEHK